MYNNDIGLIDAQYVMDNSTLFNNVEAKFIEPSIIRCQNIYIQDILGSDLYKVVIDAYTAYVNSGTALPSRISTLTENYILPVLLHYVIYDILPDFYIKITAQGLLRSKGTDNGDAITAEDLDKMRKIYEDRAQFYGERTTNYLILNSSTYPEYLTMTSQDDIYPSGKNYKGFYIGGSYNDLKNPYCCDEN